MNLKEYLAVVSMEECAEIQQSLAKSLRFGFDDKYQKDKNNWEEVLTEFYQLTAMIEELGKQVNLESFTQKSISDIKSKKLESVIHYMDFSKAKNLLD
ncbi:hypothetical protein [Carnobacterium maltaromaticum]|uniref:hypothetical protein n=1 Tax=Carnobacterium maltaromaticum TaxID=2751 RepID=UPI00295F006E|nr:hypothetical protein [Carnobacterium maltaromaticum]